MIGREQRVVLASATSNCSVVNSGVPQGFVLGPLLFVVFINDLLDLVENKTKLYADDSKIFFSYDTSISTPKLLQDDLDSLVIWANEWSLELNLIKCKVMHFGKKNKKFVYTMLDADLNRTTLTESNLERRYSSL